MPDLSPLDRTQPFAGPAGRLDQSSATGAPARERASAPGRVIEDRLELSESSRSRIESSRSQTTGSQGGRMIDRSLDLRPDRAELVQRVRGEIASGAYVTDEKLDLALDALLASGDLRR